MSTELRADDILAMATQRAGLRTPPIVPYEASAALAMLLVRDCGSCYSIGQHVWYTTSQRDNHAQPERT